MSSAAHQPIRLDRKWKRRRGSARARGVTYGSSFFPPSKSPVRRETLMKASSKKNRVRRELPAGRVQIQRNRASESDLLATTQQGSCGDTKETDRCRLRSRNDRDRRPDGERASDGSALGTNGLRSVTSIVDRILDAVDGELLETRARRAAVCTNTRLEVDTGDAAGCISH